MADYQAAIPYFVDPSRVFVGQNSCEVLVIHGTGGNPNQTAQQLGEYFRTNAEITSSHYGIDRAGVVAQYVLEKDGSAANCCVDPGYDPFWQPYLDKYHNLNLCTISIEHENDLTNSLALTDSQKQASFNLVAYLSKKYNIAFDHIKSHASIAPVNRARCPGPAYPWNELEAFLGGSSMGVPTGWHDDGTSLTAPNGVSMRDGFRNHVLTSPNWDATNMPLVVEQPANPVQYHNLTLGPGTIQPFRDFVLWWTAAKGVVQEPYSGLEIWACYQKINELGQKPPLATGVADAVNTLKAVNTIVQGAINKLSS